MAYEIRLLSSKTDQELFNHLKTTSGEELKFFAPSEDENDALVNTSTGSILTKQEMFDKIQNGEMKGSLKEGEGIHWDHLVVELGSNEDYAKGAMPIILERFRSPDITFVKNQGNGRIQEKKVSGDKQIMYGLHEDAHGYHLHVMVSRYSIEDNKINPQDAQTDKYVRQKYLDKINEDLDAAGFAQISNYESASASRTNFDKPTLATKADIKELVVNDSEEAITEYIERSNNDAISPALLDQNISSSEKELATLLEAAKRKKAEIEKYQLAKNLIEENDRLNRLNKQIVDSNKTLVEAHEKILVEIKEEVSKRAEIEQERNDFEQRFVDVSGKLSNSIELTEAQKAEIEEYRILNEDLGSQNQQLEIQNQALEKEVEKIPELEKQVTAQALTIDNLQENNNVLKDNLKSKDSQLETMNKLLENLEKRFTTLEERYSSVETQNKAVVEENSRYQRIIDAIGNRLEQANAMLAKLVSKIKDPAEKEEVKAVAELIKQEPFLQASADTERDARLEQLRKQLTDKTKSDDENNKNNTSDPNRPKNK